MPISPAMTAWVIAFLIGQLLFDGFPNDGPGDAREPGRLT